MHTSPAAPCYPQHLVEPVVLRLGQRCLLRPVRPQDSSLLQAFVAGLSTATRRCRFHGALRCLSPERAQRMASVDYQREMSLVVTVPAEGAGEDAGGTAEHLIAEARYATEPGTDRAEFAIAVADAWTGQGLAKRLMLGLARCAQKAGLRRLQGDVLADNTAMLALMQRTGFVISRHPMASGLVLVSCEVAALLLVGSGIQR